MQSPGECAHPCTHFRRCSGIKRKKERKKNSLPCEPYLVALLPRTLFCGRVLFVFLSFLRVRKILAGAGFWSVVFISSTLCFRHLRDPEFFCFFLGQSKAGIEKRWEEEKENEGERWCRVVTTYRGGEPLVPATFFCPSRRSWFLQSEETEQRCKGGAFPAPNQLLKKILRKMITKNDSMAESGRNGGETGGSWCGDKIAGYPNWNNSPSLPQSHPTAPPRKEEKRESVTL